MTTQHTPGPWAASSVADKASHCGCRKACAIFELGDYYVYPAPGQAGPVAIAAGKDNARVVATAPEMLDALKLWLYYDNQDESDFAHVGPMLLYARAIEATRAVVARALDDAMLAERAK